MDKDKLETSKQKLEVEKERLVNELKRFAKPDSNISGDWQTKMPEFDKERSEEPNEENADQIEEFENLIALEHNLEARLQEVTQALEKIQKGKFGICEKCKKLIPEKRLGANPAAKTCLRC